MDDQNQQNNYWNPQDDNIAPAAEPTVVSEDQASPPEQPFQQAPISWAAKEYIHTERGFLWFLAFALIVIAFTAISIFLLKSWTFALLIVVMAFALIVYVSRPPRDIAYTLSPTDGLYIDETLYRYEDIKSFGVVQDAQEPYVMLIPRKRFSPAISVFFNSEVGADVVDALGARIPMEAIKSDLIDKAIRKLRL